uniref:Uncharacterized protein n=1 Tax=Steinernema glaseri TaxID=37863 RepID=A0A1I7YF05_9BILA
MENRIVLGALMTISQKTKRVGLIDRSRFDKMCTKNKDKKNDINELKKEVQMVSFEGTFWPATRTSGRAQRSAEGAADQTDVFAR